MVEISPLTASDRAEWEALARAYKAHFNTELSDEGYAQTWRRLIDGAQIHGVAARLDGTLVGFAHYYFHTSVWSAGNCRAYLQDLFVHNEIRRQGVARALIERVAKEAEEGGAARLHWDTTADNTTARALYESIVDYNGFIAYTRHLNTSKSTLAQGA